MKLSATYAGIKMTIKVINNNWLGNFIIFSFKAFYTFKA